MFLFPNDPDRPGHGWLDKPIARPWGSAVYLIFDVVPNGVRLTAIDARTWRPLGCTRFSGRSAPIGVSTPATPTSACTGASPSANRSRTWPRVPGSGAPTGHNVYLYRSSGYGPWTARWTSGVTRHPAVEVRIPAGRRYFEDYVDIHLEG